MAKRLGDKPRRVLLVTNAQYYFHSKACHVRIIQNLVSTRYIERLVQQYGKKVSIEYGKKVSVLYGKY